MLQIPDQFFREISAEHKLQLPELGTYGVGMVYFPQDATVRQAFEQQFETIIREEGQVLLGWRTCPPTILRWARRLN